MKSIKNNDCSDDGAATCLPITQVWDASAAATEMIASAAGQSRAIEFRVEQHAQKLKIEAKHLCPNPSSRRLYFCMDKTRPNVYI